ncbi:hypothetical protein SLS53_003765 [Cytospora paraplurivora]|uniref:C3HC-type domain-containing protein n=1 Tax=Cytospora paraplurivora TaxID=2898453 RepID=A0AAN9YIK1_9PEZI
MDFVKKRKLNALLNDFGSNRSSYPTTTSSPAHAHDTAYTYDPDDAPQTPQTPPTNRDSTVTLADSMSSTIRTPASDSLSLRYSPSAVSRSIPQSDLDLLAKRRRLGFPDSTPSKGINAQHGGQTQGQTTMSNIVLKKWNGNSNKEKNIVFKPKYCPGDREELLKRLASFQELTDWTPKPDPVNEVQWAKRGWTCQGKERVRCTLCNKELVVKLNRKQVDGKEISVLVPSEIEDALVAKYVELIVASHSEDCLWRKRGCDDSLLRLPLSSRHTAIEDLRKRYDELCARKDFLPYEFNLRLPEKLDIDTVLRQLPPDFFTVPPPPPPPAGATPNPPASSGPSRVALALAILGWQGLSNARIGPVPNTASCHTCLRRLGLWMFKSKEVNPDTGAVIVPAPMDHLDPLREHRFFCPWKNADAQRINPETPARRRLPGGGESEDEDRPGWEMLLLVLKNEAYLRSRETPQQSSTPSSTSKWTPFKSVRRAAGGGGGGTPGSPQTPSKKTASPAGQDSSPRATAPGGGGGDDGEEIAEEEEDDEKTQNAKDKERWARLRRVKSLLSTKGPNKLRRSITQSRPGSRARSRPGTAHDEGGAQQGGAQQGGEEGTTAPAGAAAAEQTT